MAATFEFLVSSRFVPAVGVVWVNFRLGGKRASVLDILTFFMSSA
jgi:hypothetical protein